MSELRLSYPACVLMEKSRITAADVNLLKTRIFADGLNRRDDVAMLLAIQHSLAEKCVEWNHFFVEILSDHVVDRLSPFGTMTEAKADWLRRTVSRGGIVASRNEFDVLVRIIERTGCASPSVAAFALEQVRMAVVDGEGPLATRRKGLWAMLGMDHLGVLNRILAALGSRDPFSIADAEALFDPTQNLVPDRSATPWGQFVSTLVRPVPAERLTAA